MEKILNVHEAFKVLKKHYITDNFQLVSGYIRDGRLKGERATRKDGWKIKEDDLYDFIDEEKPGIVEMVYVFERYADTVLAPTSENYLRKKGSLLAISDENKEDNSPPSLISNDTGQYEIPLESKNETGAENPENNTVEILNVFKTLLDKKFDELQKQVSYMLKKEIKDLSVKIKDNHPTPMSYDEVLDYLKKENKLTQEDAEQYQEELRAVYHVYYDSEELVKDGIYKDGKYHCSITENNSTKIHLLIKKTFDDLFDKAKNKELPINIEQGDRMSGEQENDHGEKKGENEEEKAELEQQKDSEEPSGDKISIGTENLV
ncbi:hypothetical protein [Fictibacillus fluitans]|uniref:DNA-binding protein n=1 Tax=Fictibacillus fluitans TaxID=3058422 RepID=A0ABT8HXN1_9BACL|nr:hypothetical protein [Fictibacillus sp. NE201]MDN4525503.1 hypothetical protein [Fictibacillus sp. NE201]